MTTGPSRSPVGTDDLIVCAMPSCVAKRAKDADTLREAATCLEGEALSIRKAYKIKAGVGIVADNAEKRLCQQYERVARRLRQMAESQS